MESRTLVLNHICLCQQEHMPLVSVLCNPGLRAHHWEDMSRIAGSSLTPDSSTTLRKLLKQNLTPYLEELESISSVASKVRMCCPFQHHVMNMLIQNVLRML